MNVTRAILWCGNYCPINGTIFGKKTVSSFKQCCYDHQTFTATLLVGYHRTNTAIAAFYSVLGGLSGRCFLKTAPHFCRVG